MVQSCHRDSSGRGHVDVEVVHHGLALLLTQSSEREHANLRGDVVPVAWNFILNQLLLELTPHRTDSAGDLLQFFEPFLSQDLVFQDQSSHLSGSGGWNPVVTADDLFHLRLDGCRYGGIRADKVKSTAPFSVQAHDLGKGLSHTKLKASIDEHPDWLCVLLNISRHKALVGHIKEYVEPLTITEIR